MAESANDLYLDLLKRTLCGALYDQPPVPLDLFWARRGWVKRALIPLYRAVSRLLGIQICFPARNTAEDIELGRIWPVQALSMIGLRRMHNLSMCLETILREGIPGDLIETGVWRGGACILMKGLLELHGDQQRKVFVADSFCGLPKPDAAVYPEDAKDDHYRVSSYLGVSRKQVEENFKRFRLLDDRVIFVEGWFKDTLPRLPASPLALLRLDGDMYQSTIEALTNLYPKLSPGGFCIVDDFMIEGCRRAVEDYRAQDDIQEPIQEIDGWAIFWRKAGP
jgi:O-methyltransferase